MTETTNPTDTIDARVAETHVSRLVETCIQIGLTRGEKVRSPPPKDRNARLWWELGQNLGPSRLCYQDGRMTIYVDQHVLGGESVKVYVGDSAHLVLDADAVEFVPGYAPKLTGERKLKHYEAGDWEKDLDESSRRVA